MRESAELEWHKGFIRVYIDDGLRVDGSNFTILLANRETRIRGVYMGYSVYTLGRRGERKVVYVRFAFRGRGVAGSPSGLLAETGDFSVGPFGLSYTKLDGIEYYLTVYAPPGYLYEHAVLSSRMLALFMHGRRQVYEMEEDGERVLLFV